MGCKRETAKKKCTKYGILTSKKSNYIISLCYTSLWQITLTQAIIYVLKKGYRMRIKKSYTKVTKTNNEVIKDERMKLRLFTAFFISIDEKDELQGN